MKWLTQYTPEECEWTSGWQRQPFLRQAGALARRCQLLAADATIVLRRVAVWGFDRVYLEFIGGGRFRMPER